MWLAKMPLKSVIAGFPISIMVLLVGVTYFFAIAQVNGTVDRVIEKVLAKAGDSVLTLPLVFFALTGGVSAMGSPLSGLVMAPIGMPIARRSGMDPMLMALAIGTGLSAGAFAPTSLFGIVTRGTARHANIDVNAFTLFVVAVIANIVLLIAAFLFFGGSKLMRRGGQALPSAKSEIVQKRPAFTKSQTATVFCIIGIVIAVVACSVAGLEPDIGVLCFAFAAALSLVDPKSSKAAVSKIDWSTVMLVGGIITFVGVLQTMGCVEMLGGVARTVSIPILSSLIICLVGALVSAFASTTGILAALMPLALPLIASGDVPGWAIISALAVCASIVDVSPFSTVGATLIAAAAEEERPRMTSLLTRWGLALVIVGPIVLVGILVVPGLL